jgi:hypothetical protein
MFGYFDALNTMRCTPVGRTQLGVPTSVVAVGTRYQSGQDHTGEGHAKENDPQADFDATQTATFAGVPTGSGGRVRKTGSLSAMCWRKSRFSRSASV